MPVPYDLDPALVGRRSKRLSSSPPPRKDLKNPSCLPSIRTDRDYKQITNFGGQCGPTCNWPVWESLQATENSSSVCILWERTGKLWILDVDLTQANPRRKAAGGTASKPLRSRSRFVDEGGGYKGRTAAWWVAWMGQMDRFSEHVLH